MSSQTHSASPTGADGVVRCYGHGLRAAFRTSQTAANPNRQYYCCPVDRDSRCKFFYWADDPVLSAHNAPVPTDASPRVPSPHLQAVTPTKSQPTTQKQDSSPASSQMTPAQKRLEQIKEALSQSSGATDNIPTSSTSQKSRKITTSPSVNSPSLPGPSRQPLDFDVGPYSEFSSPISPSTPSKSRRESLEDDDLFFFVDSGETCLLEACLLETPSTPSRKATVSSDLRSPKRPRPADWNVDDAISTVLTPPNSLTHTRRSVNPTSSPTQTKGNGGALSLLSQRINNDELHGEKKLSGSQLSSQGHSPRGRAASLHAPLTSSLYMPESPVSSETFPNPVKMQVEPTSESVWSFLDGWSIVPAYVKKMERKQLAMDKSNDAKVKKIAEQQKQISILWAKVRALEEDNALLRARGP